MRSSGVLMHISSLPSPYGIGTMGKEARKFADFLKKAGQKYWQILPVCPTSYGDSPYQSFSSFAGNPYFIDLETLCEEKLLTKKECESYPWGTNPRYVDYGVMYESRYPLLKKAYARFRKHTPSDFSDFCEKEAEWLDDYALFMALKDAHGGDSWFLWEPELKTRKKRALDKARAEYAEDICFYQMLQYLFYRQWRRLKAYVNDLGIEIIGDVPIYVAGDSADVWANPKQFYLDKELNPIDVAGCPPDVFSVDGQLWGNPLFRWDVMKRDGYSWWIKRIGAVCQLYDVVRIDHFRGFDSYYAIPGKDETARNGEWRKGPGIELFHAIEEAIGRPNIIVEDLGFLTPSVVELVKQTGYPGMKILQFAFGDTPDNAYLPHNYDKNCVVYTGTHDNETVLSWYQGTDGKTRKYAKAYMNLSKKEGIHWGVMRTAWNSVANLAIMPMQDILGLGDEGRMNTPSTLGGNWEWRALAEDFTGKLAHKIHRYTKMSNRLPIELAEKQEQTKKNKADGLKKDGRPKKKA